MGYESLPKKKRGNFSFFGQQKKIRQEHLLHIDLHEWEREEVAYWRLVVLS